ncbi:hypothetical protein CFT12S02847_07565 [Campylobacter fetus subsp. testudinum]|uniref:hypothetical protein n=1 Tax=Campylobacter fetus TaxID=196 RepID=UPI0008187F6E|nr:hypothetical protein [Campylobacter fetus]OCR95660.1 hypothetical protein CFT12S02847_07565 [Campylobacter fetus subsp. testudinum]
MTYHDKKLLKFFSHYVWWEDQDKLIEENPLRIVASAMKDANDISSFLKVCKFSNNTLKQTLLQAQPGWIDKKSWYFWHYRLYGINTTVPPFPKRGYLNEITKANIA